MQVLSAEVITSLPNANIADALGRLPSVTLERDEGEGKYVQIRGTEPRLSNLTIDGVNVPSPKAACGKSSWTFWRPTWCPKSANQQNACRPTWTATASAAG